MQSALAAARIGHRSSLGTVANALRWALPLAAAASVAACLTSAVTSAVLTSTTVPPAAVVYEPHFDGPHLIP